MLNVNFTGVVDGVPYINNKPAKKCDGCCLCAKPPMNEACSPWLCPECGAHLSHSGICTNGCHMTFAQKRKFDSILSDVQQHVEMRNRMNNNAISPTERF